MDVDYNAVDTGTSGLDPVAEMLRRKGLPPVSFLTGQPQPSQPTMATPPTVPQQEQASAGAPAVSFLTRQPQASPSLRNTAPPQQEEISEEPPLAQKAPSVTLTTSGNPSAAAASQPTGELPLGKTPAVSLMAPSTTANVKPTAAATLTPSFLQRFLEMQRQEPTREQFPAKPLPVWRKLLGGVAAVGAGIVNPNEARVAADEIFGGPERKAEKQFEQAHQTWEGRMASIAKGASIADTESQINERNAQAERDRAAPGRQPAAQRPENLDREAFDYYVGQGMTPAQARIQVLKDADSANTHRPATHTSPFEAFAYGDEKERKAAQDFMDLEHRLGSRYKTPTEFDEKYRLYQEDPDAYRAMFGDKGDGKTDAATATKMLNYFDKRRREIQGDFTLSDDEKKQQMTDIDNLSKPFMDVVQPGATGNGGGDRVNVIRSDGKHGTIPRSQLRAAKKRGYREAPSQ